MKKVLLLAAVCAVAALSAGIATTTATKTTVSAANWAPGPHEPWQWMISGTFNPTNAAHLKGGATDQPTVYDIDGFLNSAATVQTLHSRGYHVICYIEVGSWTDFRADSALFPSILIGQKIDGFSDRWTDIRSPLLRPIIENRIKMCASKGFDAVEPDLEDGYTNNTGFPLTANDQIVFNTWVAKTVHDNGMSVLLKGDPEQAKQLASTVDFFLNEECNDFSECDQYTALAAGGKTVLNAEYSGRCPTSDFSLTNLNTTLFNVDLNGSRTPCANSKGGGTASPPTTSSSTTTTTTTTTAAPKPTNPGDPVEPQPSTPTTSSTTTTTTTTTQPPPTSPPTRPSRNTNRWPRWGDHRHTRGRG